MKKGGRCDQIDYADREVADLARRQHGYATRAQLISLGLGPGAIKYRARIGRLIPVHAGVYAVGHLPTLALDRAHGALLACGPDAVLSHGSAASVWGIQKQWKMPFEVIVPRQVRRPGICTHSAWLSRQDRAVNLGLRVTGLPRTLLDLAPRVTPRALERTVDDMRNARHLRVDQLADTVARYPRHPGAPGVRAILAEPRNATRSEMELGFLQFVERYALPKPLINTKLADYEVDALFPRERVIVELDGWMFHSSRRSFEGDRERDTALTALGYLTIRITWERLTGDPDREAARLHEILASQRRLLGSTS